MRVSRFCQRTVVMNLTEKGRWLLILDGLSLFTHILDIVVSTLGTVTLVSLTVTAR